MSTALTPIDQHAVKIGSETYTLANIPDTSKLVAEARKKILGEIQLDDMVSKLNLVGKLLFVAYNGVASQAVLRGEISTLQVNYMKLCSRSEVAMESFATNCEELLTKLGDLFTYLLSAKESTALIYMEEIAGIAKEMATEAKKLEEAFEGFSAEATKALANAETAKGTEEEKKAALVRARANYEALTAGAKELVQQITAQKAKLQKLYEEAKEAAEKHENRAFAMGMVGAIFGGIGQGLGAAANMYMAAKMPVQLPSAPAPAPSGAGTSAKADEATKAKEALEKATEGLTKAKAEVKEAETELGTARDNVKKIEAELKPAPPTGDTTTKPDADKADTAAKPEPSKPDATAKPEAGKPDATAKPDSGKAEATITTGDKQTEPVKTDRKTDSVENRLTKAKQAVTAAEKNLDAKKTALETAEQTEKQAKSKHTLAAAALRGIGDSVSSTGQGLTNASESYAAIAASYNEERKKYLDMLLKNQEEEGKALANIKEYAVRMENLKSDVSTTQVVIEALHQALGALKQIVVILCNATELWTRMAKQCQDRARDSEGLGTKIKNWQRETPEERLREYTSGPFLREAIRLSAGFIALHGVTNEYSASVRRIKTEVQDNVQKNITTDDMLKLAIQEGKVLSASASTGIATNKAEIEAIRAEQQKPA